MTDEDKTVLAGWFCMMVGGSMAWGLGGFLFTFGLGLFLMAQIP